MAYHDEQNRETIRTLNKLIQTCKDGEQGFRTAAEAMETSEYKQLLYNYSEQRAQFASELQAEVRRLGGEPEKSGDTPAAMHRGWINLRSAISGGDIGAILVEVERGEDVAVDAYEDALDEDLPSNVRSLVEEQYNAVLAAHDRIRALEMAHN